MSLLFFFCSFRDISADDLWRIAFVEKLVNPKGIHDEDDDAADGSPGRRGSQRVGGGSGIFGSMEDLKARQGGRANKSQGNCHNTILIPIVALFVSIAAQASQRFGGLAALGSSVRDLVSTQVGSLAGAGSGSGKEGRRPSASGSLRKPSFLAALGGGGDGGGGHDGSGSVSGASSVASGPLDSSGHAPGAGSAWGAAGGKIVPTDDRTSPLTKVTSRDLLDDMEPQLTAIPEADIEEGLR